MIHAWRLQYEVTFVVYYIYYGYTIKCIILTISTVYNMKLLPYINTLL